jgi:very-short-patch-repair endonuclease
LKTHACFTEKQIEEIHKLYSSGLSSYDIIKKGYKTKLVITALRGKYRSISTAITIAHKNKPEVFKHTKATKDKISKARIKFLNENPDKVPYKVNHSSKKSWPEEIFETALKTHNIKGWKRNFQNSIYEYDFAFLLEKIDVEVDGQTHESEKVKKIDAKRDVWSKQQGWTVIRFKASIVKKDVNQCIAELSKILEKRL